MEQIGEYHKERFFKNIENITKRLRRVEEGVKILCASSMSFRQKQERME